MAFPINPVLDDFNRADQGTGPPSANWTNMGHSTNDFRVLSSQCAYAVSTDLPNDYWNVSSFGPDSEAYVKFVTLPSSGSAKLCIRIQSGSLGNYYLLRLTAPSVVTIRRASNYATTLLTTLSQTVSAGDSLGISAVGNILTGWYRSGSGSWVSLGTATDVTYQTAGFIGLDADASTGTVFDDFGGGTIGGASKGIMTLKTGWWGDL